MLQDDFDQASGFERRNWLRCQLSIWSEAWPEVEDAASKSTYVSRKKALLLTAILITTLCSLAAEEALQNKKKTRDYQSQQFLKQIVGKGGTSVVNNVGT